MCTAIRRRGRGGDWRDRKAYRCDGLAGTDTETVAQSSFPRERSNTALGTNPEGATLPAVVHWMSLRRRWFMGMLKFCSFTACTVVAGDSRFFEKYKKMQHRRAAGLRQSKNLMHCYVLYLDVCIYVALQKTTNFIQRATHKIRRNRQKTHLIQKKQKVARHIEIPQGNIIVTANQDLKSTLSYWGR